MTTPLAERVIKNTSSFDMLDAETLRGMKIPEATLASEMPRLSSGVIKSADDFAQVDSMLETAAQNFANTDTAVAAQADKIIEGLPGGESEKIGPFTPGQFLGVSAGLTAAQTALQMNSIKSAEKDALAAMAEEFDIAVTDLEGRSNLREAAQRSAMTRRLMRKMNSLRGAGAGPVQRQMFLRDPETGTLL